MRRRLIDLAKKEPMIEALREIPGVDWVRAATLVVFVDTPFRFKSKEKLLEVSGHRPGASPERSRHTGNSATAKILK